MAKLELDRECLIQERDALRATISQLQQSQSRMFQNPFGAIGTGMRSTSHTDSQRNIPDPNHDRHGYGH